MRKILLLGGSAQQIIAIETAKKLGYYTILCDYLPDNPGQEAADKFYQVSTTDKEAVLEVAKKENINGIVAYSSDPAAPTAAFVSQEMKLPGIPYSIATSFCEKNLFRVFLKDNNFNVPGFVELNKNSTISELSALCYPIIIKPSDSSGSKGVTIIESGTEFLAALKYAAEYARNGVIIAEEFIVRDHKDVIEAEIFVVDGEVQVWGLINSVRDKETNPLVPAAYSYPLNVSEERVKLVKDEISKLVHCSRVKYGAFNIEMIITQDEKLYFLDAGPRNGGNELPEYIGDIAKKDMVKATIEAALGNYEALSDVKLDGKEGGYWGLVVLHSAEDGVLEKVEYSTEAKKCLLRESYFIEPGNEVHRFLKSWDAIGLAFFSFPTIGLRDEVLNDFAGKHIQIKLK